MEIYIRLLLVGLLPIGLSVALYFAKETEFYKRIPQKYVHIVAGVLFGGVSVLGTVFGVDVGGAVANARDAAPLCAGLLFSGTSGIIAGVMGGVYRFIATYWGAGAYSQFACTISTILAGFFGAALRKYMFEGKRPSWAFALATAVVIEVFHMTVLFLTHLDQAETSYEIVKICTVPMIVCNAFAVTVSAVLLDLFSRRKRENVSGGKRITNQIQKGLLIVVIIAYFATTAFVYALQTGTAERSAESIIEISIDDVKDEIKNDVANVEKIAPDRHVGVSGYVIIADSDKNIVSVTKEYNGDLSGKNLAEVGFDGIDGKDVLKSFETTVCGNVSFCMYSVTDEGYYVVSVISHDEVYASRDSSVYINSYMEVLVFAALFFIVYNLIKRKVVDNVISVNESLGKIIDGDMDITVDVKANDEFRSLSDYINTTVSTLKRYTEEASARIDRELAFAKSIQHSAIPSVFPAYPNNPEFDIYASMFTAKEVGGDFYDFYIYGENKLVFLIADVSGKGIPAAMFMMRAKTLLKSLAESGLTPDEVFTAANEKLCSGNDAGMFVTSWMGVLDFKTGHVDFVNAGHNPPFVYRKGEGFSKIQSRPGFVLAGLEGVKFKVQSIDLKAGDRIFLYTDGVTEANDKDNALFGEDRLVAYLNKNAEVDVDKLLDGVKYSVDDFANGAEQFDDITMLVLQYNGDSAKDDGTARKTFLADRKEMDNVNAFLESVLDKYEVSTKTKYQILVATEEIFVNVASYAYGDKQGFVVIKAASDGKKITLTFIDGGVPFNPLEKQDPDTTLSAEERDIGGLGIFMVKKTMDKTSYENIDGRNILTIEKNII